MLEELPLEAKTLDALKRQMLPATIANLVAEAIAQQSLHAGERLVETTLAAQFDVSRVPVREALKILHTQGIITGGGHRGFRVASFSPKMVRSVQEARLDLETLMLRDAVVNFSNGTASIASLDAVIDMMRTMARIGDFAGMLRADLDFHHAICAAAQNQIFTALWSTIARHVMIILNLARFHDVDLNIVVLRHQQLRDEIAEKIGGKVTAEELRDLLTAHFQFERTQRGSADDQEPGAVKPRASRRRPVSMSPL